MSGAELEPLLARLRQLSLVRVDAVLAGTTGDERQALAAALVSDVEDALGEAHRRAQALVADLARGPGPLATPLTPARHRADPETRAAWRARLALQAGQARDLQRLYAAAAAVLPVLEEASRL